MSSSLSSVVSNLVRASMGSAVSNTVTDEDLDRHVADLILKEAKKKAERYGQDGIRAYLPNGGMSDSNAPKTNKRFLSSIIRSTDDHNKTILRAQALAAQEVKRERDEMERRERRARAEEAVAAERLRRLMGEGSSRGSSRRIKEEENWDRWDGRTADRKRKQRTWETWDGEDDGDGKERDRDRPRQRRRHRSRSGEGRRRRDKDKRSEQPLDGGLSLSKRRSRFRTRSRSPMGVHSDDGGSRTEDGRSSRHRRTRDKELTSSKRKSRRSRGRSPSEVLSDETDGFSDYYDRKSRQSDSHNDRHRPHRRHLSPSSPSPTHRSRSPSTAQTEGSGPRKTRRPRSLTRQSGGVDSEHLYQSRGHSRRTTDSLMNSDREAELRGKLKTDNNFLAGSPERNRSTTRSRSTSLESRPQHGQPSRTAMITPNDFRSRSPSPGPDPAIQLPSKMDKYFEESYDPRLDVAPLAPPTVPTTGLINNAEFEGWDAMLELLRIRREDKEEKKRMERLGLSKDKLKRKGAIDSKSVNDRWTGDGVSVMEIEYKKRGSVREWDMGKEGF